jgi:cytochrome c553
MNRKAAILLIPVLISGLLLVVLFATVSQARPQGTPEHKSVWNGVYTDAEATRGQALYENLCVNCHGVALTGGASMGAPQLAGDKFMENWREATVEDLFLKIRNTMPRQGFQGNDKSLNDRETLDLISFIFKKNGFPTGPELNPTVVANLWIEQKDGPKPLPNLSQIQIIGCMEQDADNWVLNKVAQPTRLRKSGEGVAPDVLKAADAKPLGTLKYRLQNLVMLGSFNAESHKGHKMLAQGVLIRQGGSDRISVTQLEMVSASCGQ